jgi:hypothetical protein
MNDLPIVCTLSPEALNARKKGLLARVAALSKRTTATEAGYRFEYDPDSETLTRIIEMIDAERQCCRFLRFDLTVPADAGSVSLDVTGPAGTREFLDALLEPS